MNFDDTSDFELVKSQVIKDWEATHDGKHPTKTQWQEEVARLRDCTPRTVRAWDKKVKDQTQWPTRPRDPEPRRIQPTGTDG